MRLGFVAFASFEWIRDYEEVKSDWTNTDDGTPRSAEGPNSLWKQTAWHFWHKHLGPWFWLEPDAFPCSKTWHQELLHEYKVGRKPYMGMLVRGTDRQGRVVPDHMSGVAIYHEATPSVMSGAMMAVHKPFDLAKPEEINSRVNFTKRIFHTFRPPPFTSREDFDSRVSRDTLIYHACKDGSILPFLRERIFGVATGNPDSNGAPPGRVSVPAVGVTGLNFTPHPEIKASFREIPKVHIATKEAPKTWIEGVRSLVAALVKDISPSRKQQIQEELRKAGLMGPAKKRKPRRLSR